MNDNEHQILNYAAMLWKALSCKSGDSCICDCNIYVMFTYEFTDVSFVYCSNYVEIYNIFIFYF